MFASTLAIFARSLVLAAMVCLAMSSTSTHPEYLTPMIRRDRTTAEEQGANQAAYDLADNSIEIAISVFGNIKQSSNQINLGLDLCVLS